MIQFPAYRRTVVAPNYADYWQITAGCLPHTDGVRLYDSEEAGEKIVQTVVFHKRGKRHARCYKRSSAANAHISAVTVLSAIGTEKSLLSASNSPRIIPTKSSCCRCRNTSFRRSLKFSRRQMRTSFENRRCRLLKLSIYTIKEIEFTKNFI